MTQPRKLLSVGHSYSVALNRRLADEIGKQSGGAWEVTVAAPTFMSGDLRPTPLEPALPNSSPVVGIPVYLSKHIHVMSYGRGLKHLIQSCPWDLLHIWEEPYVWSGYQIGRWADRIPHIHYTFQNIAKSYPPPFSWFEKWTVGRSSGWIAAGRTVLEALAKKEIYRNKPSQLIPLGVDIDYFHPDRSSGLSVLNRLGWSQPGLPVVGFLGRFVPQKGLSVLLPALEQIKAAHRILFVGGGVLEGQLLDWARKQGEHVRVVTGVRHGEVPAYINAMDMLVAPSQTTPSWCEQLGRMLIEAFAVGIPVIGSDSGEIRYVIGDAGLVLPEADISAWTNAIGGLLDSPGERIRLGAAGRERAESVFAWSVIAKQHIQFFEELLSKKRLPGPSP
ncbi:MAG: glycosyltransferase family 4 protein [Fimbriiglobus sp.]